MTIKRRQAAEKSGARDMQKATNLIFHLFNGDERERNFYLSFTSSSRLIGFDVYAKYEKL